MRDDIERAGCDRRSRCPKDVLLPAAEKGAVGWEKVKSGFKQLGMTLMTRTHTGVPDRSGCPGFRRRSGTPPGYRRGISRGGASPLAIAFLRIQRCSLPFLRRDQSARECLTLPYLAPLPSPSPHSNDYNLFKICQSTERSTDHADQRNNQFMITLVSDESTGQLEGKCMS